MHAETEQPMGGELLDQLPTQQAPQQALAVTDNPYMAMASRAMELGKVDQLDKLLDLQMRWDAEQQRKAFVSAMSDFKAEAGGITIAKSKRVSFTTSKGKTEYDHAELHDITRALVPVMAKYGLSHRWTLTQASGAITVECVVSHRDGHSERVSMTAPPDDSGGKNTIQSIASTKSYLERYTFLASTGMATGGEIDNDGRTYATTEADFITEEQEAILRDLMEANVRNHDKFLSWLKVEKLSDLLAANYNIAFNQLKLLEKERNGGAIA